MDLFMIPKHVKNQKGFTLVELLIVVAIIAILAAIAIPQMAKYRKEAAAKACLADLKNAVNECALDLAAHPTNTTCSGYKTETENASSISISIDNTSGVITGTAQCKGAADGVTASCNSNGVCSTS